MATKIIKNEDEFITVKFNNGDLEALRKIRDKWNFKDIESALRFGLAVLVESEEGILCKQEKDLSITILRPTSDTKK